MPLEKHLAVHLQETYATEHGYREYLRGLADGLHNQQLKSSIREQIHGIDTELDRLREALSMMGATPDAEMISPIVQALRREDQITEQAMPDMTTADHDAHVAMTDIGFGHLEIGMYQGMISMAKELGRRNMVDLLQKTLSDEQKDLREMQELLPKLLRESQQQQRAA